MTHSIDWARIADLYDTYVRSDFDIPFFVSETGTVRGEVLELMSGTGRMSIPLIKAGVKLTCVDASAEMLAILRAKLKEQNLCASVHHVDVRELDLGRTFDLIFIPFHSFAELPTAADQRKALDAVQRHLTAGGRFICTLHNPRTRLKRVDSQLRLWGNYERQNGAGTLLFWGLEHLDSDPHSVSGLELFEEYDPAGILQSKRMVELHYRVVEKREFEELAAAAGLQQEALFGDYQRAEFQEERGPFMIWILRKP